MWHGQPGVPSLLGQPGGAGAEALGADRGDGFTLFLGVHSQIWALTAIHEERVPVQD